MLCQLDELEGRYETVETDRKARNAVLQNGEFSPPSDTIFEEIFQDAQTERAAGKE